MNDLWVIGLTGAVVGGALGWPLVRWPPVTNNMTTAPLRLVGGLLLLGAMAAALIAADHGQLTPPLVAISVDHLLAAGDLFFWAVFTVWIRHATGLQTSTTGILTLIGVPLMAYAAYAVPAQSPPRFIWLLPAGVLASVYAIVRWLHVAGYRPATNSDRLRTRMVMFGAAICAAQAIRTAWPRADAVREIVPITLTVGFVSIAALAMRRVFSGPGEGDARVDTGPAYARSALDQSAAAQVLVAIEGGMREHQWYRDPQLSLRFLAEKAGTTPHAISQALNQVDGRNLHEYLAVWRVAEARRQLCDPANERFTIDALAESAGFRSRSAFYKAFKAIEGMTPTEFRARRRSGSS